MRQIAIDTNVLVRLFVDDDLVQRDKALELLESADSVIVPTTVFLECVWVLTRSYKMEKNLVLQQLRSFSESIPNLVIQEDELGAGFAIMEDNGDFADGVNEFLGRMMGASYFVTFDRKAAVLLESKGLVVEQIK